MDDDDIFDENSSELNVMDREWKKVSEARKRDGFIEGSSAGQNEMLQKGFNSGFKQGLLSSFLISQIKGILKAVIAYHTSYEGHPITDDILLETQNILEDLSQLESDKVAEDFLRLNIHPEQPQRIDGDVHCSNLGEMNIDGETKPKCSTGDCCRNRNMQDVLTEGIASSPEDFTLSEVTFQEARNTLLTCPQIQLIVHRCKDVLKRLHWSHDVLDFLI